MQELRGLTGWRRFVSLCLDLMDVATPLLRAAFMQASSFASWLLIALIGRGLGLIYQGIRQSIYPGSRNNSARHADRNAGRSWQKWGFV